MAIKVNASAQGGTSFKKYVGVGSFRVLGVNPTKAELEKFYGKEVASEPQYLLDKVDENDGNKPYKLLRVTFMIQADDPKTVNEINPNDKKSRETNAALTEPLKTTVSFFLDSRYFYNRDKTKVQVIDKYGRTAWCTVDQCKNHQIPVYANGPAKLDADYTPAFRGEEALTNFFLNYLNITPVESYNTNTGQWIPFPHPSDCEFKLYHIKDYFKGDISELKEFCSLIPTNYLKLLTGIRTDNEGKQFISVHTRATMRNGARSYKPFQDSVNAMASSDTVFSNDPAGVIHNIEEYKENVQETDFSNASANDPFAEAAAIPEAGSDLPFDSQADEDPFAGM